MTLTSREYTDGDYDKYIKSLVKTNMQDLFKANFGGWSDPISKKRFFKALTDGFIQLFFLEEEFVGYVSFNEELNEKDSYLINDIHVGKDFQRKGYGLEILNFVESKLIELNAKRIKLLVFKDTSAVNFYIKNGFKEMGYLEKSNSFIMIKTL